MNCLKESVTEFLMQRAQEEFGSCYQLPTREDMMQWAAKEFGIEDYALESEDHWLWDVACEVYETLDNHYN